MPHTKFDGIPSAGPAVPAVPKAPSFLSPTFSQGPGPNLAVIELHLSGLTSGQSFNLIAHEALAWTKADGAAVAIASGHEVTCRARAGTLAPALGSAVQAESGISGAVMRSGEVINCGDVERDERVDAEACRSAGIRSMLAVPLIDGERRYGVFAVFSRETDAFGEREMNVMLLLSGLIPAPTTATEEAAAQTEAKRAVAAGSGPVRANASKGPRVLCTARQLASHLETIRQDAGIQLLGRVKAYLRIEGLYDSEDRSDAIELCEDLMLERAEELGVVVTGGPAR